MRDRNLTPSSERGGVGYGRWVAGCEVPFQATLGRVKVSEILRLLHRDGWVLVTTRGSHRQFKHPLKLGRVTVAGKPGDDLAPGTLASILKQAGLK